MISLRIAVMILVGAGSLHGGFNAEVSRKPPPESASHRSANQSDSPPEVELLRPTVRLGAEESASAASEALLYNPRAVAFDKNGTLYVFDAGNHRIAKFDIGTGELVGTIGRAGSGPGEFNGRGAHLFNDLAVDGAHVLALEPETGRYNLFDVDGAAIRTSVLPAYVTGVDIWRTTMFAGLTPRRPGDPTVVALPLSGGEREELVFARFGADVSGDAARAGIGPANEAVIAVAENGLVARAHVRFPFVAVYDQDGREVHSAWLDFSWWSTPALQRVRVDMIPFETIERLREDPDAVDTFATRTGFKPVFLDIEPLPLGGDDGWLLTMNGGVVQALSSALQPLRAYRPGIVLTDIALSGDGETLCGVDPREHVVLCYEPPGWGRS